MISGSCSIPWVLTLRQFGFALMLCGLALIQAGCVSEGTTSSKLGAPSPRDRVLLQYQQAGDALRRGQYAEAKPLLDDALLT